MTAMNLQPTILRCTLLAGLISCPLDSAFAESSPGQKSPRRSRAKRVIKPEKRHDPTELDRRLMPAPVFGKSKAPVGGLMVDEAHWNPLRPAAAKHFTINGGQNAGLRTGDRLIVWRGKHQTVVAEVEVVAVGQETAQIFVLRQPEPGKVLPLDVQGVITGDRVSLLMRANDSIWPKPKKRKRARRIVRKKQPSNIQKAAEAAPMPAGKDTIVIGGRELPKANAPGVSLTPAQLPEVGGQQGRKPDTKR
jgi:hypothetical protein